MEVLFLSFSDSSMAQLTDMVAGLCCTWHRDLGRSKPWPGGAGLEAFFVRTGYDNRDLQKVPMSHEEMLCLALGKEGSQKPALNQSWKMGLSFHKRENGSGSGSNFTTHNGHLSVKAAL